MNKNGYRVALIALALSGCVTTGANYRSPAIELPEGWVSTPGKSLPAAGQKWWKIYGDTQLDRLIEEALANNVDLHVAVARVDEARARLGLEKADQMPTADADYERNRGQSSQRTATPIPGRRNNNRAAFNVSYELDLWGRLRSATAAARAELIGSEAAYKTVRIVLAAEVTQTWFSIRALDDQINAMRRSIAARGESLDLQKKRYEAGVTSEFDYRQREAEVAAARARIPAFELRRAREESGLEVLLGRSPRSVYEGSVDRMNDLSDSWSALVVPVGLPSELVLRRPDLIEAEQRLIAASARVAAVRAEMFPSISLTGFLGSESVKLRDLFSGPAGLWQVAAVGAQPVFSGGRLKVGIASAQARERQALAQYQRAIQNAFKEVRDAIVAQTRAREQFDAESLRVDVLRETLRLARLRYEIGVASQLEVLDAERNLLDAEINRSAAFLTQRAAIADLFKALGGGWEL